VKKGDVEDGSTSAAATGTSAAADKTSLNKLLSVQSVNGGGNGSRDNQVQQPQQKGPGNIELIGTNELPVYSDAHSFNRHLYFIRSRDT
jgi:hypothetical protein